MPGSLSLFRIFLNPFNATTTFCQQSGWSRRLEIFTTLGQQITLLVDGEQEGGFHNFLWRADVTSGIYYYRLIATPRSDPGKRYSGTRKMVLMR
jgi:hypothetical protein